MASQVLSGNSPFSYTNNTGQNVRVVIGYLDASIPAGTTGGSIIVSFPGVTIQYNPAASGLVMGKNLPNATGLATQVPNEIYLSQGQTISISTGYVLNGGAGPIVSNGAVRYNILVIPEAG